MKGTGVAVITPFDTAGKIDTAAIHRLTEHLVQGGVEYLVVLGSTGEAATLNPTEKELVLNTYFEANQGRLPIVVGVGGNDTREVCHQVTHFTGKYPKLAGVLSVSPYYNKPSQEGIYQHYKAVASATDLPVILYNVPGRTGSNMLASTTLRLAHDIPNIVAMKEASGNLEQMMEIIHQKPADFTLISGDDALTLPMIAAGGEGVISVVAHAVPRNFSDMVRAAIKGDIATAKNLHYQIWEWYSLAFAEGNPVSIKMILATMGICSPQVQLPLVQGSENLRQTALKLLQQKI